MVDKKDLVGGGDKPTHFLLGHHLLDNRWFMVVDSSASSVHNKMQSLGNWILTGTLYGPFFDVFFEGLMSMFHLQPGCHFDLSQHGSATQLEPGPSSTFWSGWCCIHPAVLIRGLGGGGWGGFHQCWSFSVPHTVRYLVGGDCNHGISWFSIYWE